MRSSSFPRWLDQVDRILWILFLIWMAVGFVVMPLGIGDAHLPGLALPPALESLLAAALRAGDAVWITLAASVVYLSVAGREGFPTARLWASILLTGSGLVEWVGATSGWPFGPYRYSDHFGARLGGVLPYSIPLAWLVIVLGARCLILRWRSDSGRFAVAAGVGFVALLTDLNLEFVAWKARAYWIWYPDWNLERGPLPSWPPLQNYISWFLLAALLAFLLPSPRRVDTGTPQPVRPILVLTLMNALFLTVHVARALRAP